MSSALHLSRMAMWRRITGETPLTGEELITLSKVLDVPVGAFFSESSAASVELASAEVAA
ncbi:hypothetical protein ACFVR6_03880 [Microbacterium sp. NPDC058021]|uniref:hypothetical protein n=1 Tax=Microbacterium sp. NPDC058021 TaxID=3346306 RepID=UPI0036DB675B